LIAPIVKYLLLFNSGVWFVSFLGKGVGEDGVDERVGNGNKKALQKEVLLFGSARAIGLAQA